MPESSESLFRGEALAHHRRADAPEALVPLTISGWRITAAYRGLGVLVVLAIAALCLVRVDARVGGRFNASRVAGPVDTWQITATFPWRYREALTSGGRLRLSDSAGCLTLVTAIARIDDAASAPSGGSAATEPLATVRAEIGGRPCSGDERSGAAEATIDRAPLIVILFPRLRAPLARLHEAM